MDRLLAISFLALTCACGSAPNGEEPARKDEPETVPLALSGGQLMLPAPIVFAGAGQAAVAPECEPVLRMVKTWLDGHRDFTLLRIEVHSDGAGDRSASQSLSEQRALEIGKRLVALGVDCRRLVAVGFGGTKPMADEATPDGRAKNRRVELRPAALRGKPIGGMPVDGGGKVGGDPCAK